MKRTSLALAFALASLPAVAHADHDYRIDTYLRDVARGNVDLAAQRFNVSIAEAQVSVAKVFPDPVVTGGLLQYDLTQQSSTASIVSVTLPVQIDGQRGARIHVAEAGVAAANADLEDFLRTVRANAANAFVDALHAKLVLERRKQTLASLEKLVDGNKHRVSAGDIGDLQLVQSRVEAEQFRAQVRDAEGEVRTFELGATQFLGASRPHDPISLSGDLKLAADRTFDENALVALALKNRPDLRAAARRKTQAERNISLVRRNRFVDIAIGATWQHNFATTSPFPLPASDFIGTTLTIPIPISRLYHGDLDAAYAGESQAVELVRSVELRVETDVRQAVSRYSAAAARVKLYTGGVLSDADTVLDRTLYDYQRGNVRQLEVLEAQRTVNEVYLSYYDALADSAHALIAVEQSVGSWDVAF